MSNKGTIFLTDDFNEHCYHDTNVGTIVVEFSKENIKILTDDKDDLIIEIRENCELWTKLFNARENDSRKTNSVIITREVLRDNLGFSVHDLGDFWQCEKEDFVLIQPKFQLAPGREMPFIFGYKSNTSEPKTVSFTEVHHLQNFYFYFQQKELIWENISQSAR